MPNIFEIDSYRGVLKESLAEKKKTLGREYTFEKMAQACRLQRTYLSSVLAGQGHLNSDQIFMACQFLGFKENEYLYTNLLQELERSAFPSRQKRLRQEIASLKKQNLSTETHLSSSSTTESEKLTEFYLDFNAQLIHMFLTVDRFRTDLPLLNRTLGLHNSIFQEAIKKLSSAGIISIHDDQITVSKDNFHLPPTSTIYQTYLTQMRLRALDCMQRQNRDDHYSFSVLFSTNASAKRKIHTDFLKFLEVSQKESQKVSADHVYQMNFDLVKWSKD